MFEQIETAHTYYDLQYLAPNAVFSCPSAQELPQLDEKTLQILGPIACEDNDDVAALLDSTDSLANYTESPAVPIFFTPPPLPPPPPPPPSPPPSPLAPSPSASTSSKDVDQIKAKKRALNNIAAKKCRAKAKALALKVEEELTNLRAQLGYSAQNIERTWTDGEPTGCNIEDQVSSSGSTKIKTRKRAAKVDADEAYLSFRARNNLAVRKCRAKEKAMAQQKKLELQQLQQELQKRQTDRTS